MSGFTETFETFHAAADDYIEAGSHVVTPFTNRVTSRGIEVRAQGAWVWMFDGGAVARVSLDQELQEALEAAGVTE